jgi:hypothetical protein
MANKQTLKQALSVFGTVEKCEIIDSGALCIEIQAADLNSPVLGYGFFSIIGQYRPEFKNVESVSDKDDYYKINLTV